MNKEQLEEYKDMEEEQLEEYKDMDEEQLEEFKNIKKNREELMVSGTREELIKFDENLEMLKEEIDESIETLKKNLGDLQMIRLML